MLPDDFFSKLINPSKFTTLNYKSVGLVVHKQFFTSIFNLTKQDYLLFTTIRIIICLLDRGKPIILKIRQL